MVNMEISEVQTFVVGNPWKRWVFLLLETKDGSHGVGEATVYQSARAVVSTIEESRRYFIGKDPFRIEEIWYNWYRNSYNRNASITNVSAIAAVEIACWDIIGKQLGTPVCNLLGGTMRERLKLYANGWYTGCKTKEDFASKARLVVSKGYKAMKFDPFGAVDLHLESRQLNEAIERVAAVREAVGEQVEIMIEGHGRFTPSVAVDIGKELETYNIAWFEEPVPPEDLMALKKVSDKLDIPIAAGERFLTKYSFTSLIESHAVDIIQPDPINAGGILETKKIAAMSEAHYLLVAPHNAEGPVCSSVCAQLDATLPNFLIQESFDEFDVKWRNEIVKNPPRIVDGFMEVPRRPGLGIDIDLERIAEHLARPKQSDFDLYEEGWENRRLNE